MLIGIPKEIKNHEYRVGATPAMVQALIAAGHQVVVGHGAGSAIGYSDDLYAQAGALIGLTPADVYRADMIIKVKEPQDTEFSLLRERQILFGYLHLAPDPIQTQHLLEQKVVGIAYETVTDTEGRLPLLEPMSAIAGRISIQVGASYLQLNHHGKGILLGGIAGVLPAKVVVLGGGAAGMEAVRMALGLGAQVTVLDVDLGRLKYLDALFGPRLQTLYSSPATISEAVRVADLVVGCVLIPGKLAPKLITRNMIKSMEPGSVFIDLAIDQGGCSETSKPTTHHDPVYVVDDVTHYCVTNMPGACARTATQALNNATMKYALKIANKGYKEAIKADPGLANGLNVYLGKVTNEAVAHDLGYEYFSPDRLLAACAT